MRRSLTRSCYRCEFPNDGAYAAKSGARPKDRWSRSIGRTYSSGDSAISRGRMMLVQTA